jgi:hypothetical protein
MKIAWAIVSLLATLIMCGIFMWEIFHGKVADATLSGVIILMLRDK